MKSMKRWLATGATGVLALAVFAGCGESDDGGGSGDGSADPETLVLGLVPSGEVDKLVESADKLGVLLGEELDMPVETYVADDYAGLRTAMQTDQAHIGMFGPIGLVQAVDQADAVAVLQSIRFGAATYHTQWFTNAPDKYCLDDVVTVEDEGASYQYCNGTDEADTGPAGEDALAEIEAGTEISFVDELSASGYFYPATQLKAAGMEDYQPQFAGDHDNSVLNVYNGDFEVGVSFDDARTGLVEDNPDVGEKATVFAYSAEIPNDGVAVSGNLSEEMQQEITDAFLALTETEEGLAALDETYEIEGLVEADLDALDAARQVALDFGDE